MTHPLAQQSFAQAMQLHQAGQLGQAELLYRQALAAQPDHADSLHLLGVLCFQTNRRDDGIALLRRALALQPHHPYYNNNLGKALLDSSQFAEAADLCRRAISAMPNYLDAYNNLGNALTGFEKFDEAIATLQKAVALNPALAESHSNLANALRAKGNFPEALAAARRAISIQPNLHEPYTIIGTCLHNPDNLGEAIAAYTAARNLNPNLTDIRYNLAFALLLNGQFEAGWAEHEHRWQSSQLKAFAPHFSQPQWKGELLTDKTILVYTDQGFGDAIHLFRYLPLVAQRVGRVIAVCPPALLSLFQSSMPEFTWLKTGQPLPPFDVYCPFMSLPFAFNTTLETIPHTVPYFRPLPAQVAEWKNRLAAIPAKLRVGLAWAGNPKFKNDNLRSIPPALLAPLAQVRNVQFISLNFENKPDNAPLPLLDFTSELPTFLDTAALISSLDLVISVDTAAAHLAGALGVPVWTLLPFMPDWRWMLHRADSPWYPTMRLFRQSQPQDWPGVIASVAEALATLAGILNK